MTWRWMPLGACCSFLNAIAPFGLLCDTQSSSAARRCRSMRIAAACCGHRLTDWAEFERGWFLQRRINWSVGSRRSHSHLLCCLTFRTQSLTRSHVFRDEELRTLMNDRIAQFAVCANCRVMHCETASARNKAEERLFCQFPRVSRPTQYQSPERFILPAAVLHRLPFTGETSDDASREEELRLLGAAVAFVNANFERLSPRFTNLLTGIQ
jgi:hypothetical protein